ncbi:MAG: hypothetical protein FWD53_01765 [Phycisphaerales bacterium]|nr:hypothetical protein [Phycisphaerales bacterium]
MSAIARELLKTFESLDPEDRQEVAAEILRRSAGRWGAGDLQDETYVELARDIFEMYDKEEAGNGEG